MSGPDLHPFPGGDLVAKGLQDLAQFAITEEALLVSIASPRLKRLGLSVPELPGVPLPHEHALFEALEARLGRGAHAAYNALIGRIVSFANAYDRVAARLVAEV
jgi:hypothetical protein